MNPTHEGAKIERTEMGAAEGRGGLEFRAETMATSIGRGRRSGGRVSRLRYPLSSACSCLLYHQLTATHHVETGYDPTLGLMVHVDRFAEQMEYISQTRHCLDVGSGVRLLKQGKLPWRSAMVTFDDGYYDSIALALPILEKYRVPATVYVATGFVEKTARPWWLDLERIIRKSAHLSFTWKELRYSLDCRTAEEKIEAGQVLYGLLQPLGHEEQSQLLHTLFQTAELPPVYPVQFLDWNDLVELGKHPLITIGAHTENHPLLRALPRQDAWRELAAPKKALESRLGKPVPHLAYPFGSPAAVGPREVDLASQIGYESAFVTYFGHIGPHSARRCFTLPRITIDYFDSLRSVRRKLAGIDAFVYRYVKGNTASAYEGEGLRKYFPKRLVAQLFRSA